MPTVVEAALVMAASMGGSVIGTLYGLRLWHRRMVSKYRGYGVELPSTTDGDNVVRLRRAS